MTLETDHVVPTVHRGRHAAGTQDLGDTRDPVLCVLSDVIGRAISSSNKLAGTRMTVEAQGVANGVLDRGAFLGRQHEARRWRPDPAGHVPGGAT